MEVSLSSTMLRRSLRSTISLRVGTLSVERERSMFCATSRWKVPYISSYPPMRRPKASVPMTSLKKAFHWRSVSENQFRQSWVLSEPLLLSGMGPSLS